MIKSVSSAALLDALENSFSDAHMGGRFLQMSGLTVIADWTRPEGNRVLEARHVTRSQDQQIRKNDERKYTVAMPAFIADGFDGYACFGNQETIVSEEGAITDTQLLLRTFGYGRKDARAYHEQGVDEDAARFEKARQVVVVRWDAGGLPMVAPQLDKRIVTDR